MSAWPVVCLSSWLERVLPSFFFPSFLARRVSQRSQGSTRWRGAGMCELCGCGHQHMLWDADEVDETRHKQAHTHTHAGEETSSSVRWVGSFLHARARGPRCLSRSLDSCLSLWSVISNEELCVETLMGMRVSQFLQTNYQQCTTSWHYLQLKYQVICLPVCSASDFFPFLQKLMLPTHARTLNTHRRVDDWGIMLNVDIAVRFSVSESL